MEPVWSGTDKPERIRRDEKEKKEGKHIKRENRIKMERSYFSERLPSNRSDKSLS